MDISDGEQINLLYLLLYAFVAPVQYVSDHNLKNLMIVRRSFDMFLRKIKYIDSKIAHADCEFLERQVLYLLYHIELKWQSRPHTITEESSDAYQAALLLLERMES